MADYSDIEASLERLMPRGLANDSLERLEGVIDDLSLDADFAAPLNPVFKRTQIFKSLAAVLLLGVFGVAVWSQLNRSGHGILESAVSSIHDSHQATIEVLEQRVWLDGGEDLGIQPINESGEVHQGLSFAGV